MFESTVLDLHNGTGLNLFFFLKADLISRSLTQMLTFERTHVDNIPENVSRVFNELLLLMRDVV